MAERKVKGKDYLLFIDPAGGTDYELVICLTSNGFSLKNNIIDAATKCGPDKEPGTQEFDTSFEGQLMLSPATDRLGYYDLFTLAQNLTTVGWKLGKATPVAGDVTLSGTGFIAEFTGTMPNDGPATFSGSLGVYGSVTIAEAV